MRSSIKTRLGNLYGLINLASWRSVSAWGHDIAVAAFAWWFAYLLRFNFDIPPNYFYAFWHNLLWVVPLQALVFVAFGLYRGVWRFASMPDLYRILKAVFFAAFAISTVLVMFQPHGVVPRTVLVLDPILLLLLMGGSRFLYRAWKEHRLYGLTFKLGEPVIVLGAGEATVALVKDLSRSTDWRVVGILDDDRSMHGRQLHGIKVLGYIAQLDKVAADLSVDHVIVAMPSAAHQARRCAIQVANAAGLTVMTVPSFDDLMSGKVSISQVRRVEVEDLLGREPVKLDSAGLHDWVDQKVVLVTGAGGSIGSELCRQIVRYKPSLLICFDVSEFALYRLEQEFSGLSMTTSVMYLVGDVRNERRLQSVMSRYRPSIVFHAAAYKHVPLMEHVNVAEALSNNVVGTYTVAKACKEAGVEKFVMVSTFVLVMCWAAAAV